MSEERELHENFELKFDPPTPEGQAEFDAWWSTLPLPQRYAVLVEEKYRTSLRPWARQAMTDIEDALWEEPRG